MEENHESFVGRRAPRRRQDVRIVDAFAGLGGSSEGVRQALGVSPIAAINHWPFALGLHAKNHPETVHFVEDVFNVSPEAFARDHGYPDIFIGSPDCTHFSRAKGSKPLDAGRRALANVFILWAMALRPRIIVLENVEEFTTWGPLDANDRPDPMRAGEYFKSWCEQLRLLGYHIEWRMLRACDFGAPTSRKRLFIIARCDGLPITWPKPTHGPGRAHAHIPAADIIDWGIEIPSIFNRKRGPLAPNTLRRIAAGIRRFVVESADPFLLCLTHGGRLEPVREPLRTITTANRGERALVVPELLGVPHLMTNTSGHAPGSVEHPVPTLTTGQQQAVVMASLALLAQGPKSPNECRAPDIRAPLPTVVGGGNRFGVVETEAVHDVAAAHLLRQFGTSLSGADIRVPHPTVMPGGCGKSALVTTQMSPESDAVAPRGSDNSALVAAFIAKHYTGATGSSLRSPLATVTGVDHNALVGAYLDQYNGTAIGRSLHDPVGTVTTTDRFSLVYVHGIPYRITDIKMRMLTGEELKRAQGFPKDYVLQGSKTDCIQAIGNAVPPPFMRAIIHALTENLDEW